MNKFLRLILIIIVFTLMITLFINVYMIKSAQNQIVSLNNEELYNNVDAILVLGCKVYTNGPSEMLEKRLDKAEEIYKFNNTKIILSGDHGRNDYDEVNIMKDYLLNSDINSKDIFLDHAGFSTYDSIYRAKNIFGAKKIIIVTQKFHMYRALFIANALDIEAYGIVANDINNRSILLKNEIREIFRR